MVAGVHDYVHVRFIDYDCCDPAVVLWSCIPEVHFRLEGSEMVLVGRNYQARSYTSHIVYLSKIYENIRD